MDIVILLLLGLAFGSFVTALTWRLHTGKDFVAGRSQCEHCAHTLGILDLMPVLSWVFLKGRCRYCKKSIGWENPLIELSMAALFVISYLVWPQPLIAWQAWLSFAIWLIYCILLIALLVYDYKWMLLPNKLVFVLIGLAGVDILLRLSILGNLTILSLVQHVVLGIAALAGVYGLLYIISKGKWVGFGDVKLGIFMGIVLGGKLALLTLFLANIIGFLCVIPGLLLRKITPKSRIPFGPFLIIAFLIAGLFGERILTWYLSITFQVVQ